MVADVLHFYSGAVEKHRPVPPSRWRAVSISPGTSLWEWWRPFVPWNFPIAITSWKIGPPWPVAIRGGETCPISHRSPRSDWPSSPSTRGIPEGVLEVVVGRGTTVGTVLVEHPDGRQGDLHRLHR